MPGAGPIFALLGLGGVLALAAASTAKASPSVPKPGSTGRVVLDSSLPEQLSTQVLHAISTSTDPRELRALASQMLAQGYPLAAAALNAKAAGLEALGAAGNVTPPPIASSSTPSTASPPTSLGGLDPSIDPTTAQAVMQLLTGTGTDPAPLVALASSIRGQYPLAAAALMIKATALQAAARAAQAATPMPSPLPGPIPPAPGSPADPGPRVIQVPVPYPVAVPQATPDGPGTWVLATDRDVSADGVAPRFQALLSQPVGTVITEVHNGRTWQFRVISKTTDPNLTTYAKDVKGWLWHGAGSPAANAANVPPVHPGAAARVMQPVPSSATLKSVPPNPTILHLQHYLNVLGVASPPLVEDGVNGPKTIATVKSFQHAHGLKVDGIAGPQTNDALATALSQMPGAPPPTQMPPPPAPTASMPWRPAIQSIPASPAPVAPGLNTLRDVQHALNVLGVASPPLVEDGVNGPKTIAAVKAFQQARGLTVDGDPGPLTKAALLRANQDRATMTAGAWSPAP
jgi:peptidoglycan hydrolase-like protein with peptidoglycan-binding domain